MDTIENPAPPVEVPTPTPVPTGDQTPPASPPPPAATLATQGDVTDERALEIQRREAAIEERERLARDCEMNIAERERKTQEREAALRQPVTAPAAKAKRKRNWSDPVICEEEVEA